MQGWFILAIICAIITAAAAVTWLAARRAARKTAEPAPGGSRYKGGYDATDTEKTRFWAGFAALAFGALTALFILVSSFNVVGTQNIGIVTSFGRPVAYVGNGVQWTYPWESVTDMDYAVQVTDYASGPGPANLGCMTVRIADQQTACVTVKVRWRINPKASDSNFRNYKGSTSGIEAGLLTPELQNTANTVFDGYDPVGLLNSKIAQGQPGNPTVPQLGAQIQAALTAKIGGDVQVLSLFTPNVTYDPSVQARLNAVLAQKADTLVAQQAAQTAAAQAAANTAIAASVSHDPAVLTSRCLDIMAQIVKDGHTPPVGMCNLSGTSTPVIVSGK